MTTLQETFAQIPDPRGTRGKRYPLPVFLILILLGTMSGYGGYRGLELNQVAAVLNAWMKAERWVEAGDDCAIDGKSLANTLNHHKDSYQNFVSIVSVFQLRDGLVVGQKIFENGKRSEIVVVQELIEALQLTGMVFSLDALHLQKNS